MPLPTLIWRHRKENLKKCSLSGLESRQDLLFFQGVEPPNFLSKDYFLLDMESSPLTSQDRKQGLFLIDATWRYLERMKKKLPPLEKRGLPPGWITAYPRKQTACPDPQRGLASGSLIYRLSTFRKGSYRPFCILSLEKPLLRKKPTSFSLVRNIS